MHLCTLIATTLAVRAGHRRLSDSKDDPDYISAVQATFIARDMLEQASFVQVGRSNHSEACYLARPGSTHLRIRVAAHEPVRSASTEGVVASLVFVNRHTDDVREWGRLVGYYTDFIITEKIDNFGKQQQANIQCVANAQKTFVYMKVRFQIAAWRVLSPRQWKGYKLAARFELIGRVDRTTGLEEARDEGLL